LEGEVSLHPAIAMFALCDNMKWSHLPNAGGLYDQDPDFIEKMQHLFSERNEHQRKEQEEQRRKMESKKSTGPVKRPRRR